LSREQVNNTKKTNDSYQIRSKNKHYTAPTDPARNTSQKARRAMIRLKTLYAARMPPYMAPRPDACL